MAGIPESLAHPGALGGHPQIQGWDGASPSSKSTSRAHPGSSRWDWVWLGHSHESEH